MTRPLTRRKALVGPLAAASAVAGATNAAFGGPPKADPSRLTQGHPAEPGDLPVRPRFRRGSSVDVRDFGATGDGLTDDTAAIQAAIDYAMYTAQSNGGRVWMPAGIYKTTDCLHLGYGVGLRSVVLEGEGYNYRGGRNFCGTTIKPTFSDRPTINIQGARGTVVRGLSIIGQLITRIDTYKMATMSPTIDDTNEASWIDPGLSTNQDSRYAPYAAITIDAYSGPRPATSYPDVTYPAFLGGDIQTSARRAPGAPKVAQYGKSYSSDVLIEDVFIYGFTVGIANQPCDADMNGDFTTIRRCNIEKCKWGISVGNAQSRNVHIQCLKGSSLYAVLTNRRHGRQRGKFGGAIIDMSIGEAINIVDFGSAFPQPLTFVNLYAEALWRIGTITAGSSNESSVIFENCQFNFTGQNDTRGIPAYIIDGGAQPINLQFIGGTFEEYPSVLTIGHATAKFDGCRFNNENRTQLYEKFANNALAGGLVTVRLEHARGQGRIKYKPYDLDTGQIGAAIFSGPEQRKATRNICASVYASEIAAADDNSAPPIRMPFLADPETNVIAKTTLASLSLSNKTLTFTFTARADWEFYRNGPLPGDVLWDDKSGSVFFVRSRIGLTVLAELQNNYRSNGAGGYNAITPFSTEVGYLYVVNSRVYTPRYYLRGDMAAASAIITNVARDDDYAAWFDPQIASNDYVWVSDHHDCWVSPSVTRIRARDQAAGTITLTGSTGMRAQTRRRLELFIRQPPANV